MEEEKYAPKHHQQSALLDYGGNYFEANHFGTLSDFKHVTHLFRQINNYLRVDLSKVFSR